MPKAKTLSSWLKSAGFKALFVVSVMLLNVSLSTLSSAVAYADTAEPEQTEVLEETTEVTVEEESTQEEALESEEEAGEVETPVESEEIVDESTEVVEEATVEATEVVEAAVAVPAVDLTATFGCWSRQSLTEFTFSVETESSMAHDWATGSTYNNADPDSYNAILPTMFESGSEVVAVAMWDGGDFTWTLGQSDVDVSTDNERCDDPTLAEIIEGEEDLSLIGQLLGAEDRTCALLQKVVLSPSAGPVTLFLPTNDAIVGIVSSPATSDNELNQLLGNPDELCALIASHVVDGEYVSTDVPAAGVTLPAFANDVDGIFAQLVDGSVYIDGNLVVEADLFGSNGVIHKVGGVLLPQSVGTINPIVTDKTSPALSGMIDTMMMSGEQEIEFEYCVVVRVNGVPFIADVAGNTWTIDEGVISINPTNEILFDVVVRAGFGIYSDGLNGYYGCEMPAMEYVPVGAVTTSNSIVDVVTHGGQLFGLTMNRNVVTYLQPEEPEEPGEVLGETTPVVVEEEAQPVVVAAQTCGKGVCGDTVAQANDPTTTDTDGDGVVDSEDPDPSDPNVTGIEDAETNEDENTSEDSADADDDDANVLLWFLAGGGVVAVWYLLWQRSGRES